MPPVTVVVQRRIKPGCEARFSVAMHEFVEFALAFPGHLDIQVLLSGDGEYTVVDRYVDQAARDAFIASPEYVRRVGELRELSQEEPRFQQTGGLGGWFALAGRPAPSPLRMGVVTFLGVYPLTSILPPTFTRLLSAWPPLAVNFVVTALVVALLSWPVMPLLIRLFQAWLHPKENLP